MPQAARTVRTEAARRPARRRRAAAVVAVGLGCAAAGCTNSDSNSDSSASSSSAAEESESTVQQAVDLADVVEQVSPSVVTIETDGGLGSGVVFREDIVLTNEHVVGDARSVTIVFADGTSADGTVLATDEVTDLAVVRSARGDLPVPEYRTELPRPGQTVLAIGTPLGFEGTVSEGIVSGVDRQITGSGSPALVDLIQIDAAISPGNSGGALLDAQGRVIGINEAYIPPTQGAVALGFAIPAATAVDVAEQLIDNGSAVHPYLGVALAPLTADVSEDLGVSTDEGALVLQVEEGGPADEAGVEAGDVVVDFDGEQITSVEELLGALRDTSPGDEVDLTVERAGDEEDLTVTVGALGS